MRRSLVDREATRATGKGERGGLLRFLLPVVAVWAVPVVIAAIAIPLSISRETAAITDAAPQYVEAGSIVDDGTTPVSVELVAPSSSDITARIGGIVTGVNLEPGSSIGPGQELLSVGDVLVRAQVALSPIVGDVDPYRTGADVRRVAELLAQVGLLDGAAVSDTYTWSLRQAINAWNAGANLPQDGVFRVASTIFLSESQTAVSEVLVRVGDSLGEGSAVAELVQHVSGVRFAPAADGTLTGLTDGPLVFAVADRTFDLAGLDPSGDELAAFTTFLTEATAAGLLRNSEADGTRTLLGGTLSRADPTRLATVPNAAVYVSDSGDVCVFRVGDGQSIAAAAAVPVPEAVPLSGAVGLTAIGAGHAGARFVADISQVPAEVLGRCA